LTEEKSRVLKWIKNKTLEQFKTIYLLLISKARCEILLPKVYALKNLILLPVYALIQPRKLFVLVFHFSVPWTMASCPWCYSNSSWNQVV